MKETYISFFKELREKIIAEFESLEPSARFVRTAWDHHSGGGGEMGLLRGDIFEKAGVNFSAVKGDKFPMQDGAGPFFASGVSLITHMKNPKMPTVHMNVRYIETKDRSWIGGGYECTHFWADPKRNFVGIIMSQNNEVRAPGYELNDKFRGELYKQL